MILQGGQEKSLTQVENALKPWPRNCTMILAMPPDNAAIRSPNFSRSNLEVALSDSARSLEILKVVTLVPENCLFP